MNSFDQIRAQAEADASSLLDDTMLISSLALLLGLDDAADQALATAALSIPSDLRDAVLGLKRDGYISGDAVGLKWVVISEALALTATAGLPDADRLNTAARRLLMAPHWVSVRWEQRCAAVVQAMDARSREAWLEICERPPSLPKRPSSSESPVSVVLVQAEWVVKDPFDLWVDDVAAIDIVGDHAPTRVLYRADPSRWFRSVDGWEDPRLVQAALFRDELHRPNGPLLEFLAQGAPCLQAEGKPTGRVAGIVLCSNTLYCVRELLRAPKATENGDAAGKLIDRFCEVLLDRADGIRIAAALSVWLSESRAMARGAKYIDSDARSQILEGLTSRLRSRAVPIETYRTFAGERELLRTPSGQLWRHVLPALLHAAQVGPLEQPDSRATWIAWLRQVLRMPREWSWRSAEALVAELSSAIQSGEQPLRITQSLFEELESDRRKGEFQSAQSTDDHALPSLILLVIAYLARW